MDLDSGTEAMMQELYPDFRVRLIRLYQDFYTSYASSLRMTEGLRSYDRTVTLWNQGRTTPGPIVTHEPPGHSLHCFGIAADSCFAGGDPYLEKNPNSELLWKHFGDLATAHGLEWGGNFQGFTDRPHVQIRYGLGPSEIRFLYEYGGIPSVWAKFDQIRGVPVASEWSRGSS